MDHYQPILNWFSNGNVLQILNDSNNAEYKKALDAVDGLDAIVNSYVNYRVIEEKYLHMELVLHALAETELISKDFVNSKIEFKDPLHDALDDIFD